MNMNRPDMTEDVKSKDYTNKFLQKDPNPVTMKASKSPGQRRYPLALLYYKCIKVQVVETEKTKIFVQAHYMCFNSWLPL